MVMSMQIKWDCTRWHTRTILVQSGQGPAQKTICGSTDTLVHCVASIPIDTAKHHASERLIGPLAHVPKGLTYSGFTDPPQCMPDYCKGEDTVLAYQNYYILEKSRFAKWKKRSIPEWFSGGISDGKRSVLGLHGKTNGRGTVSA